MMDNPCIWGSGEELTKLNATVFRRAGNSLVFRGMICFQKNLGGVDGLSLEMVFEFLGVTMLMLVLSDG